MSMTCGIIILFILLHFACFIWDIFLFFLSHENFPWLLTVISISYICTYSSHCLFQVSVILRHVPLPTTACLISNLRSHGIFSFEILYYFKLFKYIGNFYSSPVFFSASLYRFPTRWISILSNHTIFLLRLGVQHIYHIIICHY